MIGLGSVEAVIAAIREDARVEVERVDRDGQAAVAALRQGEAAVPLVVADADERISTARRHAAERRAQEDWADRQSALTAREAWVAAVAASGARRLRASAGAVRRLELLRLAREGRERMPDGDCRVLVAAADLPVTDEAWRRDLAGTSPARIEIAAVPEVDAGCIVETTDGRMRFDNTYPARAHRFEREWRRALGELFDRAGVHA